MVAVFLAQHLRPAQVFIRFPTWVNHKTIWAQTGVSYIEYPYCFPEKKGVDLNGILSTLEHMARANDVVVLQACAHNPTGIDLSRT